MKHTLVLLRHGESEWNLENRFTGWTDVDLTEKGTEEAKAAGRLMKAEGYHFDVAYTSYLKRANHTLALALAEMGEANIPVVRSWKLNERHYGALQGLNKAETAKNMAKNRCISGGAPSTCSRLRLRRTTNGIPQNRPCMRRSIPRNCR